MSPQLPTRPTTQPREKSAPASAKCGNESFPLAKCFSHLHPPRNAHHKFNISLSSSKRSSIPTYILLSIPSVIWMACWAHSSHPKETQLSPYLSQLSYCSQDIIDHTRVWIRVWIFNTPTLRASGQGGRPCGTGQASRTAAAEGPGAGLPSLLQSTPSPHPPPSPGGQPHDLH